MASITTQLNEFAGPAKPQNSAPALVPASVPSRNVAILCAALLLFWTLCNAGVWAISTLAAGAWPAASLGLGWPLGLCVALVVWLGGGGFWRLIIATGWCIIFPIATPHYFELSAKIGLFLGRVPNLELITLAHAAMFFLLPTALTVSTIAWAARWQRTGRALSLTLLTTVGTAIQVCWCGQNLIDNPIMQVWVWNALMISGLCIATGHRLHQLMLQPAE